MTCSTLDTTDIRISWRELDGLAENGPLWISDMIEAGLKRDAGIVAPVCADSFTLTITVRTLDIAAAATWLKETGLI